MGRVRILMKKKIEKTTSTSRRIIINEEEVELSSRLNDTPEELINLNADELERPPEEGIPNSLGEEHTNRLNDTPEELINVNADERERLQEEGIPISLREEHTNRGSEGDLRAKRREKAKKILKIHKRIVLAREKLRQKQLRNSSETPVNRPSPASFGGLGSPVLYSYPNFLSPRFISSLSDNQRQLLPRPPLPFIRTPTLQIRSQIDVVASRLNQNQLPPFPYHVHVRRPSIGSSSQAIPRQIVADPRYLNLNSPPLFPPARHQHFGAAASLSSPAIRSQIGGVPSFFHQYSPALYSPAILPYPPPPAQPPLMIRPPPSAREPETGPGSPKSSSRKEPDR